MWKKFNYSGKATVLCIVSYFSDVATSEFFSKQFFGAVKIIDVKLLFLFLSVVIHCTTRINLLELKTHSNSIYKIKYKRWNMHSCTVDVQT